MKKPYMATWEITKKCNLNCIHCYNNSSIHNFYGLKTNDCYKIIDRMEGIKNLIITGGEPLLRKDIFNITSYAREKFETLILQTNGKSIRNFDNKFLQMFDEIDISVYGDTRTDKKVKQTNDTYLKEFLEKVKKANTEFVMATVLLSLNKNQMDYLANFAINNGAKELRIQDFIMIGRGSKDLSVSEDESVKIKSVLKEKYGDFVTILSDYECGGGDKFIEIDCKGNVSPCAFIESDENILEKDLREIINESVIFRRFEETKNMTKTQAKCQLL